MGAPGPKKSKTGLWVGIGVGVLVVIALIVTMVLVLGGGKYAGKERPALPGEFGGWSKVNDESGFGISLGSVFEKDGKKIMVMETDSSDTDDEGIPEVEGEEFDKSKIEETKPAKGVQCYTGEYEGQRSTFCGIRYEDDKLFVVAGYPDFMGGGAEPSQSDVEEAAKALAKQ